MTQAGLMSSQAEVTCSDTITATARAHLAHVQLAPIQAGTVSQPDFSEPVKQTAYVYAAPSGHAQDRPSVSSEGRGGLQGLALDP